MGNVEFALDGRFLCRGGFQLLDVLGERMLHIFKRVAQLVNLVAVLHQGQRRVEVSLGHLVSRRSQLVEGLRHFFDAPPAGKVDDDETQEDEEQEEAAQYPGEDVDEEARDDQRHRPRGVLHGLVADIHLFALHHQLVVVRTDVFTLLAAGCHGICQPAVGRCAVCGVVEDVFPDHTRPVGVAQIGSSRVNGEEVDFLLGSPLAGRV